MSERYVVKSGPLYADGYGGWVSRSKAYVFDETNATQPLNGPRKRARDCAEAWRTYVPDSAEPVRPDARAVRLTRRSVRVYVQTYALNFRSVGDVPTDGYFKAGLRGLVPRKMSQRFFSAAEARAAVHPGLLFGAGGPDDTCGWKVVRLLRRV